MNKRYLYLVIVSLVIGGFISLFASSSPDGLEKVAEDKGFIVRALEYPFDTLAPGYAVSGISSEVLAAVLAGILGSITCFVIIFLVTRLVSIKK